ncbi:DNA repair protein RecN [Pseudoclavibacter soli]|uniref:DNA repair protein RecN n=1 Tax=Pseudoclavibacter soli TaxID=452623 RepID=UPI00040C3BE8|nr:DNA repair protein RecN [Pseudoclavibacter soli]
MIEEITLRDLGVVREANLQLSDGFTAITGETGAGKTMLITALQLLQGARADRGRVRVGANQAEVTGRILVPANGDTALAVAETGGQLDDDELLVDRRVSESGRSRAWLGGRAVPTGVLAEIVAPLISIHGQSDQLRLRSTTQQRELLDRFGGEPLAEVRAAYRAGYRDWQQTEHSLRSLLDQADARAAEAVALRADVEAVEQIDPQPGELEALETKLRRIDARQDLLRRATTAYQLVSGDDWSADGRPDAAGLISEAARELGGADDAELTALGERLEAAAIDLQEIAGDLTAVLGAFDEVTAEQISQLHERVAALRDLERRFGSIDRAIDLLGAGSARLVELDADQQTVLQLRDQLAAAVARRDLAASRLHEARAAAAERLATEVTAELPGLALPNAQFGVRLSEQPLDEQGGDRIEFTLAAHPGAQPLPLTSSASGGELSRVMLALELALASTETGDQLTDRPTFVFDEVDSGVGGAAAVQIGRRLAELARSAQVVVVTHLPQVAAFADTQLLVHKSDDDATVASTVRQLDIPAREAELARMLAGTVTETALAHARELLADSRVQADERRRRPNS